jgi:hypothetical protein
MGVLECQSIRRRTCVVHEEAATVRSSRWGDIALFCKKQGFRDCSREPIGEGRIGAPLYPVAHKYSNHKPRVEGGTVKEERRRRSHGVVMTWCVHVRVCRHVTEAMPERGLKGKGFRDCSREPRGEGRIGAPLYPVAHKYSNHKPRVKGGTVKEERRRRSHDVVRTWCVRVCVIACAYVCEGSFTQPSHCTSGGVAWDVKGMGSGRMGRASPSPSMMSSMSPSSTVVSAVGTNAGTAGPAAAFPFRLASAWVSNAWRHGDLCQHANLTVRADQSETNTMRGGDEMRNESSSGIACHCRAGATHTE